jgi:hypothetical protein
MVVMPAPVRSLMSSRVTGTIGRPSGRQASAIWVTTSLARQLPSECLPTQLASAPLMAGPWCRRPGLP